MTATHDGARSHFWGAMALLVVGLAACGGGHSSSSLVASTTISPAATTTTAGGPSPSTSAASTTTRPTTPTTRPTPPTAVATTAASKAPSQVGLADQDDGHTVSIQKGGVVTVVLHSTYWTIDPPDGPVLVATGPQGYAPGQGCGATVPGSGCGTVTLYEPWGIIT